MTLRQLFVQILTIHALWRDDVLILIFSLKLWCHKEETT